MDRCEACPFDYYGFPRPEIADRLRSLAADHVERLTETPAAFLRAHPVEGWSALGYGCHVRDVLLVQRLRIQQAQDEDAPEFVPMGREERAVGYDDEDPVAVASALTAAGDALAALLDHLDDAGWARIGTYTYPEPARRDVDWIGRHTVHELHHHLADVDRVLLAALAVD